jgi:hypothetical protein
MGVSPTAILIDRAQPPRQPCGRLTSVAFRVIAANDHPDHDTIATFRRRFLFSDNQGENARQSG